MAGYIAFIGILSLFPFMMLVASLVGFFGVTEAGTHFAAFVFENIPEAIAETVEMPLVEMFQDTYGNVLTLSLLGAIWAAATGLEGVRTALNRAYRETDLTDKRMPYWRRRAQGLLLVVTFAGLLLLCLLFAPYLWFVVEELFAVSEEFQPPWQAIRYGLSGLIFLAAACTLYHWLPDRRPTWRGTLPGAVLVLVGSLIFSQVFGLFLRYFDSYASVYGSLGGVILSLLFFYYLGVIFIFGAEINAVSDEMNRQPEVTLDC